MMATEHFSPTVSKYECDFCHSADIVESLSGYVCRECGLVLEHIKLVYHSPYNKETLQNEKVSTCSTSLGTSFERSSLAKFFTRLQKIQKSEIPKEKNLKVQIKVELCKIANSLQIPGTMIDNLSSKIWQVYSSIQKGTRLRNISRLVPLVLYCYCKFNNYHLGKSQLLSNSSLTRKTFNSDLLKIIGCFPKLDEETKKKVVSHKFLYLSEEVFDMSFYFQAKDLLHLLWPLLQFSKETMIAAIISTLVMLFKAKYNNRISVNKLCSLLDVRMCSVQKSIKQNIVKRFKLQGFTSLVKSRDILRIFIEKLNASKKNGKENKNEESVKDELKPKEIIYINFNVAAQNTKKTSSLEKSQSILFVLKNSFNDFIMILWEKGKIPDPLRIEIIRYHPAKGPP